MLDETKLFDFVKIMFTKNKDYVNIKEQSKRRHHFMINRFFAIKFPGNAQMFNINGINGASVVDSWSLVAKRFTSVPMWIYTKTKKAAPKVEVYIPSEEALEVFMRLNEIGKREYNELKRFAPNQLEQNLRKIETTIKMY